MKTLLVRPQQKPLSGTITVPGDKSISHRAVMLAGLAEGESQVRGWLPAGDTLATLSVMRALGVPIHIIPQHEQAWDLTITGRGLAGLQPPAGPLNCGNAGTALRLLAGIMAGQPFPSTLDGRAQLRRRPMGRIVRPLREMGAEIEDTDSRAPLMIRPSALHGITYSLPVASAQVKSAILLAGLYAQGETRVQEPGPTRDHTERMLAAMGVPLAVDGQWITLPGAVDKLQPLHLDVPGDISSAAFPLAAAAIVPDSQVTISQVGLNQTRTGLLDLLNSMGAAVEAGQHIETAGEPAGNITLHHRPLHGIETGGEMVVRAIDEFPVWAVVASQAAGESLLRDAAELRVKEVDRISVLAGELRRLGIHLDEREDGFLVRGPVRPEGGEVDGHGDHRLGMALAVAGLVAERPVRIHNAGCISDSFPGFVETMTQLGADMAWE